MVGGSCSRKTVSKDWLSDFRWTDPIIWHFHKQISALISVSHFCDSTCRQFMKSFPIAKYKQQNNTWHNKTKKQHTKHNGKKKQISHSYCVLVSAVIEIVDEGAHLDKFFAKCSITTCALIAKWGTYLVIHAAHPLLVKIGLFQFIFHIVPPILWQPKNKNRALKWKRGQKQLCQFIPGWVTVYYLKQHVRVRKLRQCINKLLHSSSLIQQAPQPAHT